MVHDCPPTTPPSEDVVAAESMSNLERLAGAGDELRTNTQLDALTKDRGSKTGLEARSAASIDKSDETAFERLPDEIITQILRASNPNAFASLILLNRKWRSVSQRADLYAEQLSRCPSYAASHPILRPDTTHGHKDGRNQDQLPELRRLFAREVKRNLFDAYLRPKETVVKLVSNAISSSSVPGGEGMQFAASPMGHHILAYNSSRIYLIDVTGDKLDILREFKLLRKPVSACIKDDGSLLAVLSSEMQVDLYDLTQRPPKRQQSIILDNTPRSIALSPCGSVLAAAYEGGIEVSSLDAAALPTDRRAVKCDAVDTLAFSHDGIQILGTTTNSAPSNTVILTAPYLDPSSPCPTDNISAMWTSSILFPNTSKDCSHAVLLQDGSLEEAQWTFAYDRNFQRFRAVRIDDLRNGKTYFNGMTPQQEFQTVLPCTLPSASYHGDLVSAAFQGKDVWIYGVPEDLDAMPPAPAALEDNSAMATGQPPRRRNSSQSNISRMPSSTTDESSSGAAQWERLVDRRKNTVVYGHMAAEVAGVMTVKWVAGFGDHPSRERLVVGARGVSGPRLATDEEDMDFVDGGRLTLVDFDYGLTNGTKNVVTIEVGTDRAEPLEEEKRDLEAEVAIVRRRTVAQKRGGRTALLRAATTASQVPAIPTRPTHIEDQDEPGDPLLPRKIGVLPSHTHKASVPQQDPEQEEEDRAIEQIEALESPYAHGMPRSGGTLRRAATAVAVNRTLNPRLAGGRPIEYHRADGRREHPHESDADNWVPPPPPYQRDDPGDLPAFLRGPSVLPPVDMPPIPPIPSYGGHKSDSPHLEVSRGVSLRRWPSHHRTASDSTTMSRPRLEDLQRPMSSPSIQQDVDNLYDATPPMSPEPDAVHQHAPEAPRTMVGLTSGAVGLAITSQGQVLSHQESNEHAVVEDLPETSGDVSPPEQTVAAVSPESQPHLSLHIPESGPNALEPTRPTPRRLSNSQTWPLARESNPDHESEDEQPQRNYPLTAPPSDGPPSDAFSDLPPLPSSNQLQSLNRRINGQNPRRLSGSLVGSRPQSVAYESNRFSTQGLPSRPSRTSEQYSEPEQPLIISTPAGVAGAYDGPRHPNNEPLIYAPVPRNASQWQSNSNSPRPVVERLETIWSVASQDGNHPSASLEPPSHRFVPAWMSTPDLGFTMGGSGPRRQRSRAERNIQEARRRTWLGKRKSKRKVQDNNTSRPSAWPPTLDKAGGANGSQGRKCSVM